MNQHDTPITEFDCKTTGGSTQLIKAIIPLLNPAQQRMLAVMTRIWELIMTIKFFEKNCFQNNGTPLTTSLNPEMINRVKHYCTPESQQTIDTLLNFMNMSQLMNMMNIFNGEDASTGAPADIMNLFKNFGQFTTPAPENTPNTAGSSGSSDSSMGPGTTNPFAASMDPTNLMQTMMNTEQSQLYQEFMAKLDLDFNE